MASRMPPRFGRYGIEIALALAAAGLIASALAPSPADASLFGGKKKPPEDFSAARPVPPPPPVAVDGAIFHADAGYAALYEGSRARRVGDPLTIVLVEKTAASKSAGSKLSSDGSFGLTVPTTGPIASIVKSTDTQVGGNRGFTGTGTADQANSLSGEMSVTVAQVLPNGTMLIQGQKRVTLNRGDEWVRIKGIVRPADIDTDNRVLSTRVADAEISYTGKGDVARSARQGWLSRFFSVVSPF